MAHCEGSETRYDDEAERNIADAEQKAIRDSSERQKRAAKSVLRAAGCSERDGRGAKRARPSPSSKTYLPYGSGATRAFAAWI